MLALLLQRFVDGLQQLGFRTNFMRYSYDFVPVDAGGNMFRGDESKNESWLGFGREIHAAADGTVVGVVDAQPVNTAEIVDGR
jgi:hypothetical protein